MKLPTHRLCSGLSALVLAGCTSDTSAPACEAAEGVICTYLGNGEAGLGEDGVGPLEVSLYLPQDVTFGPDRQPYVVDWNNHRIRTIEDGVVQTVVGTGYLGDATDGPARDVSLNHPTHVLFDEQGRMIVSAWHNSKVMRLDPKTDRLETLCGDGRRDYGGDGGPAEQAVLDLPVATAIDREGRMLIMDQANQRIRRVEHDGVIETVVGPNAQLEPVPEGLAKVCTTNEKTGTETCKLCLEDEAEDPMCAARRPQGFAGDGGPGTEALMFQQFGQQGVPGGRIEMGADGTLYFCDTGNHRIRALDEDGMVRTVAGSGPAQFDRRFAGGYAGDGGPATEALLKSPSDVAVAPSGNLYIADTINSCVRRVEADSGDIDTVAGQCEKRGFEGDGGPASEALLNRPYGVALDEDGNLYIADTHNHRIRVVYGVER